MLNSISETNPAIKQRDTNSNMLKNVLIALALFLLLAAGIAIGKYFFSGDKNDTSGNIAKSTQAAGEDVNKDITDSRENAITRTVKRISPAIVGINVEEVREYQDPFSFFDNDPFFKQFFGNRPPQKQVVKGLGSGFIVSSDGYILTNDHVAGNATKISVTLTSGETVEAKLIGSDRNSDVAVLKIEKDNLDFARLGNSDDVIIGEWVIALGNPFGLFEINDKPTVTVGVVSATDMKVNADGNRVYKDVIQTDASINTGKSGGPLVNAEGDVIGMNTIIFTGGQFNSGSIGVGFSISINRVKKIMDEIKTKGKIERTFNVGFRIQAVDERIAKYLGLEKPIGVVVTEVQRGGISDIAGLKAEDVVIEANNEKIRNEQDLIFVINDLENGDMLKMKILRGGSEREIEFELKPAK
ncbi:MAG: trypsin-like peptidase domain-containing protein [Ignavibacteria bacterium]|nr:trypsin-like peptidase domain-containing protein [Ignavibacteria bacterium]